MAYISEESIERVRASIDIATLIGEYLDLKPSGKSYKACCPFHHEKTPSFVVTPEKNFFKCFGCGEHGDGIAFVMKMEGLDFAGAVRFLANKYGIPLEETQTNTKENEERKKLYQLNRDAMLYFYRSLLTNKKPQKYLQQRGITSAMINPFYLGYAPRSSEPFIAAMKEKGYDEQQMQEVGLILPSQQGGYYSRFRDRLMFPIISQQNHIVGFGGRILNTAKMAKYLNSPESSIFHKGDHIYGLQQLRKSRTKDRVLLVEGYMDVIALNQQGIDYAIASLGTSLTEQQARLALRYGKEVFICYDGDSAGIQAMRRAIAIFEALHVTARLIILPDGKDPDEYIRAEGKEAFEQRLKEAMDPTEFSYRLFSARFDLRKEQDRLEFLRQAPSFLSSIEAQSVAALYTEKVAQILGIQAEDLRVDVEQRRLRERLEKAPRRAAPSQETERALSNEEKFETHRDFLPKSGKYSPEGTLQYRRDVYEREFLWLYAASRLAHAKLHAAIDSISAEKQALLQRIDSIWERSVYAPVEHFAELESNENDVKMRMWMKDIRIHHEQQKGMFQPHLAEAMAEELLQRGQALLLDEQIQEHRARLHERDVDKDTILMEYTKAVRNHKEVDDE